MTKAELESKHLSDLHALAAKAGVERFRMLTRSELIAKLSDGESGGNGGGGERQSRPSSDRERPPRRRRRRSGSGDPLGDEAVGAAPPEPVADKPVPMESPKPTPAPPVERAPAPAASESADPSRPKRRRRRRRFGRRKEGVTIQDLLLPAEAGRQAILAAETREGCTTLLRSVAGDLAADSKGPDPVVLLIDPSPEELADWKREAPQAEIVAAGQARHANDALAQAASRASGGEDVILLVDSLTRLAGDDFGDTETAKQFFDAGRAQGSSGGGSLTVVVSIERPS
ncbi:MAG TPA: Rho termination factor N-terminal domain-containing protein [Solirubrobacterales bacterium]|jgi:transcription termination factor Rho|nr:Rho termination factor N-terminal domain-containing protein [Solirubrobacterales bacterium]